MASMSTVTGRALDMAELGRIAADEMEGWLREFEGYRGLVVMADEDRARVITFWDSEEAELKARHGRAAIRDRIAATVGLAVEGTEIYRVPVLEFESASE